MKITIHNLALNIPKKKVQYFISDFAKGLKEDQEKYPDATNPGTFYKFKMDMKNLKRYEKLCFMDAAEELGMFTKEPIEIKNED